MYYLHNLLEKLMKRHVTVCRDVIYGQPQIGKYINTQFE